MTPERWRHITAIFHAALAREAAERQGFVASICGDDAALRHEVSTMLAAHDEADGFGEAFVFGPAWIRDAESSTGHPTLTAGSRLGPYEVLSPIGMGGMGIVYRARDPRLRRDVALKVLLPAFADDPDRLGRFRREARVLASLNHANIAQVYGLEESDEGRALVMELVDGLTLAERIAQRVIPLPEALGIARQIAEALEVAHAHGIIHRDLKPANVKVRTDGTVKVLDFGLAKLVDEGLEIQEHTPGPVTALSTVTPAETVPGLVLGTVAYMPPEQAKGKPVDKRADLWAFGCVLFEMLTGRRAFEGETLPDVLLQVVEHEPDWNALPPNTPLLVRKLLRRCLEKDPRRRLDSAAVARLELDDAITRPARDSIAASTFSAVVPGARWRRMLLFGAGAILATGLVAVAASMWLLRTPGNTQASASPKPTPLTSDPGIERNPALSPDGRQIAYVSYGAGRSDLYLKLIGAGQPLRLTTTPDFEMSPAWSPDARFIAFLRGTGEGRGFYIIPALGGLERKVADAFGGSEAGPMPQALDWSPDGKTLAVVDKSSVDEPWSIFLLSVETGERRRLTQPPAAYKGDELVAFSPDGSRLAFVRTHDLMEDVYLVPVPGGGAPMRVTSEKANIRGVGWADNGASLVYALERGGLGSTSTLWKIPATGGLAPTQVANVGDSVVDLSVSRHGNRLAYAQLSFDTNIYSVELETETGRPDKAVAPVEFIASTRVDGDPRFSPDGLRVAFISNRSGSFEVWVCEADGKNPAQLTNFGSQARWPSWSPDGRFIAFDLRDAVGSDVYVVGADGGRARRLTMDPSGDSTPSWSKDARWIYFASNRTGRSEVWKMPAAGGAAVQLTFHGGSKPVESVDGRRVYYWRGPSGPAVWQVTLEGGDDAVALHATVDSENWAAAADGIYFLTRQASGPYTIEFFDFATRRAKQIATLGGTPGEKGVRISSIVASPDERRMLYVRRDRLEFDLMLLETFR